MERMLYPLDKLADVRNGAKFRVDRAKVSIRRYPKVSLALGTEFGAAALRVKAPVAVLIMMHIYV